MADSQSPKPQSQLALASSGRGSTSCLSRSKLKWETPTTSDAIVNSMAGYLSCRGVAGDPMSEVSNNIFFE